MVGVRRPAVFGLRVPLRSGAVRFWGLHQVLARHPSLLPILAAGWPGLDQREAPVVERWASFA